MKFSVIIPVYNAEQYLSECIDSILHQTYQNFEVILVDDGSKDNSGKICNAYTSEYSTKVFTYHKRNEGALIARDYGIKKSTGDVILFVDSDDCIREDAMHILFKNFTQYSCDLILYNLSTAPDFSNKEKRFPFTDKEIFEGNEKQKLLELMISTSKLNNLCLKAVKKELLLDLRDYHNLSFIKHGEDLLMCIPILSNAKKILYIDDILYFYRQREGSIVHTFDIQRNKSIKAVHKELETYIDSWGLSVYKPMHYAREVRGWIDSLFLLLKNKNSIETQKYKETLYQMATDPYFQTAFEKMDNHVLKPVRYKVAAYLLYHKKFNILRIMFYSLNVLNKLKSLLKA